MTFSPHGLDLFGDPIVPKKSGPLATKFEFPPFSVLNARDGEWQDRKRAWLALGIKSEVGRGDNTLGLSAEAEAYRRGEGAYAKSSKALTGNAGGATSLSRYDGSERNINGTSVFDPTLTELAYRWFAPPDGMILDPFAGGSVRGIVAGLLGYRYHGIDLRAEQVAANEEQRALLAPDADIKWVCGDSRVKLTEAPEADFVFSCPPYGDLERYSDDPLDLSTLDYAAFIVAYREIIAASVARLRADRFACFVVGDFRDKKTGHYRGFVGDTVQAFADAGAAFYNDAVLITQVGSLPIRVGKQFSASRKLGKTHQNILVFVKGDAKKAAQLCEVRR